MNAARRIVAAYLKKKALVNPLTVTRLRDGVFVLDGQGEIRDIVAQMNRLLPRMTSMSRSGIKNSTKSVKSFNFHWSNAQGKWDVVMNFGPDIDGSEFVLYAPTTSLSPLDKPWSLTEMKYVAKNLTEHPGYGSSVR
jgi:hypothetical protein